MQQDATWCNMMQYDVVNGSGQKCTGLITREKHTIITSSNLMKHIVLHIKGVMLQWHMLYLSTWCNKMQYDATGCNMM